MSAQPIPDPDRTAAPKHIGTAFDQHYLEATCQRVTGKTMGDWQGVFAKRRERLVESGRLSTGRVYQFCQLAEFFAAGIDLGDFDAFMCPHDRAVRWRLKKRKYPGL